MHTGSGQVAEVYLNGSARIDCPTELIPAPGQYLLAHDNESGSPLPVPVFSSEPTQGGFRLAPPLPSIWTPGTRLRLRGPLGHGFRLPASAHKAALIALEDPPGRLSGLMSLALKKNLEVVLVCDSIVPDLPEDVEVQPLRAIMEICKWTDFIAFDVARENLILLREIYGELMQLTAAREAQVIVRTPMPCGGLAECGVCAISTHPAWKMTCKDGPVFLLRDLFGSR